LLEVARHQWEEGRRRLAAEGEDTARSRHLAALVDAVEDELGRRVGQTFTLADLAAAYVGAEDWVRDVVLLSTPPRSRAGVRDTAVVQDAAFAQYARGAVDYRP
jgi:glutathione S-transferase